MKLNWQPKGPGTWGIPSKVPTHGYFYADYVEEASQWGVFNTETDDVMYPCNGTLVDAELKATEYTRQLVSKRYSE